MPVRVDRQSAVFGARRHQARFGGPGGNYTAVASSGDFLLINGTDHLLINGSGDRLLLSATTVTDLLSINGTDNLLINASGDKLRI